MSFAVVGNTSVLVVLLSDYSLFTVPKFLMCNLAFADLVMGLYLLLLALVDLHSTGEYFNNAWHWQYGELNIFIIKTLNLFNISSGWDIA